jgi:hypothetical protein
MPTPKQKKARQPKYQARTSLIHTPDILIRKVAHGMEAKRDTLKEKWGDKYRARVAPYRSLILKEMKARKIGAVEAAAGFLSIMKGKRKLSKIMEATIVAAGLEAAEASR